MQTRKLFTVSAIAILTAGAGVGRERLAMDQPRRRLNDGPSLAK